MELLKTREVSSEDYHKGATDREIRIKAILELNEDEMKNIVRSLVGQRKSPNEVQRFMTDLGNTLELEYLSRIGRSVVRFHDFWISGLHAEELHG